MDFSIIIPQRDSLQTLPRLFNSIPNGISAEIIVIDNSPVPISETDIDIERNYTLLWSAPCRHAGGARNVGIEKAQGKWLIFADADDYFAEGAFDVFLKYLNSDADVVYFAAQGIYSDTGELSDRGDHYTDMVCSFLSNPNNEMKIRTLFSVPWAKMIRNDFVKLRHIRFEEIRASNDIIFSLYSGYYASKILAENTVVYMVTTGKGSLTRRRDIEIIKARYGASLRRNKFLRTHGCSELQTSVMFYISESFKLGFNYFLSFLKDAIVYRQNIFVGMSRWSKTFQSIKTKNKSESKYIVK